MKNKTTSRITVSCLTMASFCSVAWSQSYDGVIDSKTSTAHVDSGITLESAGTLIGDHDSKANPDGTETRPGFFGGSGNSPINTSVTINADTLLDTNPMGSFMISPDFDLGTIEIDGLEIDMLNGQSGGTDISITMLYSTFHTVSPSFIYPGGIPFTLPIGQVGGIEHVALSQTDLGIGTLSATEDPNVFDVDLIISATVAMSVSLSLPGQDSELTDFDFPVVLPISGQLILLGNDSFRVTLGASPDPISTTVPLDGIDIPEVPFELPTLGDDTASVLYTSTENIISVDASLSFAINAIATAPACAADINDDGVLNFFDVGDFLTAFAAQDPAADFDENGQFNFFDVGDFLSAFAAGCP